MRIEFAVPQYKLTTASKEQEGYLLLLRECFGVTLTEEERTVGPEIKIICRPDQFALFMVRRHEMKMQNAFAELNPRMLRGPSETKPKRRTLIDVTENE